MFHRDNYVQLAKLSGQLGFKQIFKELTEVNQSFTQYVFDVGRGNKRIASWTSLVHFMVYKLHIILRWCGRLSLYVAWPGIMFLYLYLLLGEHYVILGWCSQQAWYMAWTVILFCYHITLLTLGVHYIILGWSDGRSCWYTKENGKKGQCLLLQIRLLGEQSLFDHLISYYLFKDVFLKITDHNHMTEKLSALRYV